MLTFKTPFVLLFIFLLPVVTLILFRQRGVSFTFSSVNFLKDLPGSWRGRCRYVPLILRLIALFLIIVALAGPRRPLQESRVVTEGVHIVLVLDTSTSMSVTDFKVNGNPVTRLAVVKKVVEDFVKKRSNDRIGLIAFAARPYTVCPLTSDHSWLVAQLKRIDFGLMADGTAIGSALASGINRLRAVEGKSKVMILLTDGINNAGSIEPKEAAKSAEAYGIKVYTIGAGSRDVERSGIQAMPGLFVPSGALAIDEKVLEDIAGVTGGKYFRATDTASLEEIYRKIDALEKTDIEDTGYREYEEFFIPFLGVALFLIFFEVLIGRTLLLKIP